jgi:DNA ligase-1
MPPPCARRSAPKNEIRAMKRFAALYAALDASTGSNDKLDALADYFRAAPAHDAAWALRFLSGGKLSRIAGAGELREWIAASSGLPAWLVEESYDHVGDLAETATLLLDDPPVSVQHERGLADWIENTLLPVAGAEPERRRAVVVAAWRDLPVEQRLVFNKLITGALRVGVSQRSVQQALARISGLDVARIAQRMMGGWSPSPDTLPRLLSPDEHADDRRQPYPFFLASPLEAAPDTLGPVQDWLLEWKWDGIRLQLLRRGAEVALWSRGEERLDGRFPEIERVAAALPDGTVIDGELLAWPDQVGGTGDALADDAPGGDDGSRPLPFTALQRRINRLKPGAKLLAEVPVRVLAYDLLELAGRDLRDEPLSARRAALAELLQRLGDPRIALSPEVHAADWSAAAALRLDARERMVEGLMLKRRDSPYRAGRRRGDWWKWKLDPLTIDAVLVYSQSGHGRRSNLYTDHTFAVWDGDRLVPVAKAYSGLDDKEMAELDRWIRGHTLERFGPVRSVPPRHVFELGFEAVNASARHKSGVAVRFPRILRWRRDKSPADADRIEALRALAR